MKATADWWGSECKGKMFLDSRCGHGGRGRLVGKFFALVDGEVVWAPRGKWTTPATWRFDPRGTPVWDPGAPIRNTQHLWHCEVCETNYPTCFASAELCMGVGADDVGHKGGLCDVPTN